MSALPRTMRWALPRHVDRPEALLDPQAEMRWLMKASEAHDAGVEPDPRRALLDPASTTEQAPTTSGSRSRPLVRRQVAALWRLRRCSTADSR